MTNDEIDYFDDAFGAIVRQLPHRRYRHVVAMIARQEALRIAGPSWQAYWEEHRGRLIQDAQEIVETRQHWARYRRR
jgi:hypothetical protein